MKLHQRIEDLHRVGEWILHRADKRIEGAIHRAKFENPWFTLDNVNHALTAVAKHYLNKEALQKFVAPYDFDANRLARNVAIVAAGNIPLVGIHDVICTYLSAHRAQIKLSEKDSALMTLLIQKIKEEARDPNLLQVVSKLDSYHAVIATGSNASAKVFEKYFGHKPHIIRRNRNAVAVLTGDEVKSKMVALGHDVFQYFGLGCRSVSKIFVPRNFDFEKLFKAVESYRHVITHAKYKNNFDYNLATLVINRIPYHTNDFLILKEDESVASRIATLHYSYYDDEDILWKSIDRDKTLIQCIVGNPVNSSIPTIPIGQAQSPSLSDYADGVDTMQFLGSL